MREKFAQNRAIGLASESSRAVPVECGATALQLQIVEQPLPGPVSQAIGSSPGAIKLKLATPPILVIATGCEKPAAAASAR